MNEVKEHTSNEDAVLRYVNAYWTDTAGQIPPMCMRADRDAWPWSNQPKHRHEQEGEGEFIRFHCLCMGEVLLLLIVL